jgi:cytochrome c oxidase assembly protein subunit 15
VSGNSSAAPIAMRTVFRLAALFTFLAVAMGAVVCATASGAACPTWPGCHPGQVVPHWQVSAFIEFTHRVVAITAGPLVLAAGLMSLRRPGPDRRVRVLPWVALTGAVVAGTVGRLVVLTGIPTWLGALDLLAALTSMTTMGVAAVLVGGRVPGTVGRPVAGPRPVPLLRLAASSVAVVVLMHVTAIFVAGPNSYTRCLGWPLWQLLDRDPHPGLQALRLGLAGLGAALVVATAVMAVRDARLRRLGGGLLVLFAAEMVLGLLIRGRLLNLGVAAGYSVLAVAVLWCLGLLTALAWTPRDAAVAADRAVAATAQSHHDPVDAGTELNRAT